MGIIKLDKKKKAYQYEDWRDRVSPAQLSKLTKQFGADTSKIYNMPVMEYYGRRLASDNTWMPDSAKKKIIPGDPNSVKGQKALGDARKLGSNFNSSFGGGSSFKSDSTISKLRKKRNY